MRRASDLVDMLNRLAKPCPEFDLEHVQDAWERSIVPAVRERSLPLGTLLEEAAPINLTARTLTLLFQRGAGFHREQVDDNLVLVCDALYEVTGARLWVMTEVAE